jgi:hypothetical protein
LFGLNVIARYITMETGREIVMKCDLTIFNESGSPGQ